MPTPIYPPLPNSASGQSMRLDGAWRYAQPIPPTAPAMSLPLNSAHIQVPGELIMQQLPFDPDQPALLECDLEIPATWAGMCIRLRIDALYGHCDLWLNGQALGNWQLAFTPLDLDLSAVAQPGSTNRLSLRLQRDWLVDAVTFGSGYADRDLTGVLRPLTLYALPQLHICRLHIDTKLHTDRSGVLELIVELAQHGDRSITNAALTLALYDPTGQLVPVHLPSVALPDLSPGASYEQRLELSIPEALSWDPEHPRLYQLVVELHAGTVLQSCQRQLGFRQIAIRDRRVYVNEHPVKLRGVNRHDAHPLYGRALPGGMARRDAELFKQANVNFIRTSHYPPPLELVEACDQLGIFLEIEAPVCFAFGMFGKTTAWEQLTPEQQADATEYVLASVRCMIEYYRSHPAVLLWSIGNESVWSPPFVAAAHAAKAADQTRPITFNWDHHRTDDQPFCEIGVDHYPAAGQMEAYAALPRPIQFDEYCHLPVYNRDELETDPGLHELWGEYLLRQWDEIYALPNGLGGSIWAGTDELFLMHSAHGVQTRGYGSWGPIDGWRRAKPELWHIQQVYAPLRVGAQAIECDPAASVIRVPIENRADFTDLSELQITWAFTPGAHIQHQESEQQPGNALPEQLGRCEISLPPHSTGELLIPARPLSAGMLRIMLADQHGTLLIEHQISISIQQQRVESLHSQPPIRPLSADDAYWFESGSGRWRLDAHTGRLNGWNAQGRLVLLNGPILALIPRDHSYLEPNRRPRRYQVDQLCSGWECTSVAPDPTEPHVLAVAGHYREARMRYRLWLEEDGVLAIQYNFTPSSPLNAWQIGLAFALDPACSTLSWQRRGLWGNYPGDHIGRPVGQALAFDQQPPYDPTRSPQWPWARDQTAAGSNDFRSTKYHITSATLTAEHGGGLTCVSDGRQHVRATALGDSIRMLCLDYADIGSEPFLQSFVALRQLTPDTALQGLVRLRLRGLVEAI